jgi:hypothetical protein
MGYLWIPKDQSEECRCGRVNFKTHCPVCGSYRVWALTKKTELRVLADGTEVPIKMWRCGVCKEYFSDIKWKVECQAPLFQYRSIRERRAADEAVAILEKEKAEGKPVREILKGVFERNLPKITGKKPDFTLEDFENNNQSNPQSVPNHENTKSHDTKSHDTKTHGEKLIEDAAEGKYEDKFFGDK